MNVSFENSSTGNVVGNVEISLLMAMLFMANVNKSDIIQLKYRCNDQEVMAHSKIAIISSNLVLNWLSWVMSTDVKGAPGRVEKTRVCF